MLVVKRPGPGERLDLKITDYGLSRNKDTNTMKDTMMMTGCGSALWMGECLPLTR